MGLVITTSPDEFSFLNDSSRVREHVWHCCAFRNCIRYAHPAEAQTARCDEHDRTSKISCVLKVVEHYDVCISLVLKAVEKSNVCVSLVLKAVENRNRCISFVFKVVEIANVCISFVLQAAEIRNMCISFVF